MLNTRKMEEEATHNISTYEY